MRSKNFKKLAKIFYIKVFDNLGIAAIVILIGGASTRFKSKKSQDIS